MTYSAAHRGNTFGAGHRKLTDEQVEKIRKDWRDGFSQHYLKDEWSVSATLIHYIVTNQRRVSKCQQ